MYRLTRFAILSKARGYLHTAKRKGIYSSSPQRVYVTRPQSKKKKQCEHKDTEQSCQSWRVMKKKKYNVDICIREQLRMSQRLE
jgi:hypothetical protein